MKNMIEASVRGRSVRRLGLWARCAAMRDETGGALVEVAIGVSVCMTLVIGAAELGRVAYAGIEVSDAARAGVQYGAQSRTNAADLPNVTTAATQDAPDVKGMTATASYFCVCSNGNTSTCAVTDCSTSRIIEYVQVKTAATVDPQIYIPGLPKSYKLTGKAVMRVEQ
jgi:Flp pilus assembly protein TadG